MFIVWVKIDFSPTWSESDIIQIGDQSWVFFWFWGSEFVSEHIWKSENLD